MLRSTIGDFHYIHNVHNVVNTGELGPPPTSFRPTLDPNVAAAAAI